LGGSKEGSEPDTLEQFDNIDDVWTFFVTIIEWCLDQHFPLKRISCKTTKRHSPWMSDDVMVAIHQKNRAKHAAEKTEDAVDFSIYKKMKNSLKSMIPSANLAYLYELLQKSHKFSHVAAQLWSQVNAVIGRQSASKVSSVGGNLSLEAINVFFFVLWPLHLFCFTACNCSNMVSILYDCCFRCACSVTDIRCQEGYC